MVVIFLMVMAIAVGALGMSAIGALLAGDPVRGGFTTLATFGFGAVIACLAATLVAFTPQLLAWNRGVKFGNGGVPGAMGDNSNTQFALLALWTARRYDVPVECPILFSYRRFQLTQGSDGGWGESARRRPCPSPQLRQE